MPEGQKKFSRRSQGVPSKSNKHSVAALKPTTSLEARVLLTDSTERSVCLQTRVIDHSNSRDSRNNHAAIVIELQGPSYTTCIDSEDGGKVCAQVDVSQISRIEQVKLDSESVTGSFRICYQIVARTQAQRGVAIGQSLAREEDAFSTVFHDADGDLSVLYVLVEPATWQRRKANVFFDELWILVSFMSRRCSMKVLVEDCTLPSKALSEASDYLKSLRRSADMNLPSSFSEEPEVCEEVPMEFDATAVIAGKIVESICLGYPRVLSQQVMENAVSFNASKCRWPVVIEAAQARGWRLVVSPQGGDINDFQCNVHWLDDGHINQCLQRLQPWMRVNRFPGMHHLLGRKCQLARAMARLKKICPSEYDHIPRTWTLPQDYNELISRFGREGDRTVYIVKPDGSSQGRGIFLTDDLERIRRCVEEDCGEKMRSFAVQKYISNPMLLDGYKFDLRLYFLVSAASTDAGLELRCFMFRDGLVRLCTQEYKIPTRDTFEQMYMHLTNYEVNKTNEDFKQNEDKENNGTGSKRSLVWLMDHIEAEFGKEERDRVWMEMMGICVKTILSVQLTLEVEYDTVFPKDCTGGSMGCRSFAILGFDVLLTSQRKAYLIEVNHLPSLNTDSPLDYDIKRRLIDQVLDITCSHLSATDSESYERRSCMGLAPCHLLEEPRYKDFVRAFPPTDDCPPELAAQYALVQSRVREVFNPIVTGGRRSSSQSCPRSSYHRRSTYVPMASSRSAWTDGSAPQRSAQRCSMVGAAAGAFTGPPENALRNVARLKELEEASSRAYLDSTDISGLPPDVIRERRRTTVATASLPQRCPSEPHSQRCPSESNMIPGAAKKKLRTRSSRGAKGWQSSKTRVCTPRRSLPQDSRNVDDDKCAPRASGYSAMHAAKVAQGMHRATWASTGGLA